MVKFSNVDVFFPHAVRIPYIKYDDVPVVHVALIDFVPTPMFLTDPSVGVTEHPGAYDLEPYRIHWNNCQEPGLPTRPDCKNPALGPRCYGKGSGHGHTRQCVNCKSFVLNKRNISKISFRTVEPKPIYVREHRGPKYAGEFCNCFL